MKLIFHHSEVLYDGTVTAIFEVVGGKYKGCCMITGRPHKPKIRLRMLPETHPVYGPYWSCTNVENVPVAKERNIMLFITPIGKLHNENSAS